MIESAQIWLAAFFGSWLTIVAFFAFAVMCEGTNSRGWAVWWSLLTFVGVFYVSGLSVQAFGLYAIGYVVLGVVWSFIRYHRYLKAYYAETVEYVNTHRHTTEPTHEIEVRMERVTPERMVDTITAWIIIWPVSMMENLPHDLYRYTGMFIKSSFGAMYRHSFNKIKQGD